VSRLGVVAACFILILSATSSSRADSARLLLVDPDAELEAALRVALDPWGTTIEAEMISGPGNTMPGSADRARAMARQRRAEAVVWISQSDDGFALWMYDARRDRVVVRRLTTPPPFDAPTAASVALIVKTLLRHSDVPPPAERVDEPAEEPWLRVGLLAGARLPPISEASVEPRLGLRIAGWPRGLGGHVGASIEATGGLGLDVDSARFRGHWTQAVVLASAHGRLGVGDAMDVGLAVGAGLDITTLNGVVVDPTRRASAHRINPLASAHGELGWWLSPVLRLGLRLGFVHPLRTQTYLVRGETVLRGKSLIFDGMAVLDFGLL
jgi:hypothetical protein